MRHKTVLCPSVCPRGSSEVVQRRAMRVAGYIRRGPRKFRSECMGRSKILVWLTAWLSTFTDYVIP